MSAPSPIDPELRRMVAEACGVEPGELRPEGRLLGYGLDSVRVIELVTVIEDTFDVRVREEDLTGVRTLADLDRCVASLRAAPRPR